jgi:hypothetical protein
MVGKIRGTGGARTIDFGCGVGFDIIVKLLYLDEVRFGQA